MSSFLKGIAGAAGPGSSSNGKGGGRERGREADGASPRNSAGFFGKTQDQNKGQQQKKKPQNGHQKQEEDNGFKQKMFQYGMDVQGKRDQQRKEQEIIEKKMAKQRGQKGSVPNKKADVPNGTSKVKMLTSVLGKSK